MAILRRYTNLATYQDDSSNSYSERYKGTTDGLSYTTYEVKTPTTFDLLALQNYGSPLLYWYIAEFNEYLDPTVTLQPGTQIKIPRM